MMFLTKKHLILITI